MNYKNYLLGSVSQISNCLSIVLYERSTIAERISLYNLKDFYLKYLGGSDNEKHTRLIRSKSSDNFEYTKTLPHGFNVIVYLSPITNYPIGYTEFINTQGVSLSLGIKISISQVLSDIVIDLILRNSIVGKTLGKIYIGKELYDYTSYGNVSGEYRNLYTSDIDRLGSDSKSLILCNSGYLQSDNSWKLSVNRSVTINPEYPKFSVSYYSGGLVLYGWNDLEYERYSLVGSERKVSRLVHGIAKIIGRYYVDGSGILRDIDTGKEVVSKNGNLIVDYLSPNCSLYDLPVFYTKSDVFKYIPEINNIYLDIDNYLKSQQLLVSCKIGSWYVLCWKYSGSYIYVASSPTSVVYMTKEDLENCLFVNDQTVILCKDKYYLIYNTENTQIYTENARELIEGGRQGIYKIPGTDREIDMCFLDDGTDEEHFDEYYRSGLVDIVFSDMAIQDTPLQRYRRNTYPDCSGIPKLVASYCGLIFYKINNKISYL